MIRSLIWVKEASYIPLPVFEVMPKTYGIESKEVKKSTQNLFVQIVMNNRNRSYKSLTSSFWHVAIIQTKCQYRMQMEMISHWHQVKRWNLLVKDHIIIVLLFQLDNRLIQILIVNWWIAEIVIDPLLAYMVLGKDSPWQLQTRLYKLNKEVELKLILLVFIWNRLETRC